MAILKVQSTDTVEDAFLNRYNPTSDEIIVSIARAGNIFTFTKEGGGTIQGVLLPEQDGKISGLLVATGVNNLTFDVSSGTYNIADELYSYAGGSFLLSDGDATNDRIDVAVVNDAGALVVKIGTPAATPVAAVINADEIAVASFIVKANATTATSGDVFVNEVEPLPTAGAYIPSSQVGLPVEGVGGANNLDELSDVNLGGLTAFQVLQYDGANWVNAFVDILQITGIDLTGLADTQILQYNNGTGDFEPVDFTLANLEDTDTDSADDDNILVYDGGIWEARDNVNNLALGGFTRISGIISPASFNSDQDNYNPTGLANCNVLRLTCTGNRDITGIEAQEDSRMIILINIGGSTITLTDQDGSSLADNRFAMGTDRAINSDESVMIWYDGLSNRWRVLTGVN